VALRSPGRPGSVAVDHDRAPAHHAARRVGTRRPAASGLVPAARRVGQGPLRHAQRPGAAAPAELSGPRRRRPLPRGGTGAAGVSCLPMSRSRVATAVLLVLAVPAAPCAQGVADPAPPSELAPLIEGWRADRGALQRRYAVPMSDARRERLDRLHEGWLERIARVDFDALSRPGQIDWLLFANTLRRARAELVAERARDAEVAGILPWTGALVAVLEAGERREPVCPAAAAQTVDGLARAVDECVKGLRGGKPPATLARRAAGRVGALRR